MRCRYRHLVSSKTRRRRNRSDGAQVAGNGNVIDRAAFRTVSAPVVTWSLSCLVSQGIHCNELGTPSPGYRSLAPTATPPDDVRDHPRAGYKRNRCTRSQIRAPKVRTRIHAQPIRTGRSRTGAQTQALQWKGIGHTLVSANGTQLLPESRCPQYGIPRYTLA